MKKNTNKVKKMFLFLLDETYFDTRTNFYSTTSMIINFIWSFFKFGFGLWTNSFFFCISAGYSLCIGLCKQVYLKGVKKDLDFYHQINYLNVIGIILLIASFLYTIYMGKLFIWPENSRNYGIIMAIAIAAFAFINLFVAIRGLLKIKKKNSPLLYGLKSVKLATAFSSLVLTQVSLLEACKKADTIANYSFYNAITGSICGILCIVIAICLIVYTKKIKNLNK